MLILGLAICGQGAAAEISAADRFEDCVNVRGPAVQFERWALAPCQYSGDCASFEPAEFASTIVTSCVAEALTVCAASGQVYSDACFADAEELWQPLIKDAQPEMLRAGVEAMAEAGDAYGRRRAQRLLYDWPSNNTVATDPCRFPIAPEGRVQSKGAACRFGNALAFLAQLEQARRLLEAK
ncbi:hypothetical protein [Pseudaestuariivita atlantica]|uniref:hypothetical protein n=1 Tax=Pseudaestuariivita atlantica TaxID=1317121 RepID=UPI00106CCB4C|nr:hypothetical protein [Pseudaestuariivita atlantica]